MTLHNIRIDANLNKARWFSVALEIGANWALQNDRQILVRPHEGKRASIKLMRLDATRILLEFNDAPSDIQIDLVVETSDSFISGRSEINTQETLRISSSVSSYTHNPEFGSSSFSLPLV